MSESRMPLGVREWIDARVEEGLAAHAIYDHVVVGEATIEDVECIVIVAGQSLTSLPTM